MTTPIHPETQDKAREAAARMVDAAFFEGEGITMRRIAIDLQMELDAKSAELERRTREVEGTYQVQRRLTLRAESAESALSRTREALEGMLRFCELNPEGETAFEKAVIAARATLSTTPQTAEGAKS